MICILAWTSDKQLSDLSWLFYGSLQRNCLGLCPSDKWRWKLLSKQENQLVADERTALYFRILPIATETPLPPLIWLLLRSYLPNHHTRSSSVLYPSSKAFCLACQLPSHQENSISLSAPPIATCTMLFFTGLSLVKYISLESFAKHLEI